MQSNEDRPRRWLSVDETMAVIGIGRTKLYEMLNSQVLPSARLGHLRRIPEDAVQQYMESLLAKDSVV